MTPAAFYAYVRGALQAQQDKQEIRQHLVYDLACMVRTAIWGKRMPEYRRFYPPRHKEIMSDEAMYQQVVALNAMLGGSVDGE